MFTKPITNVRYHYAAWQPAFLDTSDPDVHFVEGVPNVDEIPADTLLIIDDMLSQLANDKGLLDLFCVQSHHKSISVIFVTQSFYFDSRILRSVTRNAHYIVLFKSQRMAGTIEQLGRQLWPNRSGYLLDCFNKATLGKAYSYLFLNLHPSSDPKLTVLTNVLASEGHTQVFM